MIIDALRLGFVAKAHSIGGEVIVKTETEVAESDLKNWESIFLSIDEILIPFFIESFKWRHSNEVVLKLEDINDENKAQSFKGSGVWILKKDWPKAEQGNAFSLWLDWEVINQDKQIIGRIVAVEQYPGQWMLTVEDANKNALLIPALEDWIIELNDLERYIIMHLPEGLIEINL
ncbi:MAG: 16S rRNA processing protein RimM [Bacteroidales bacterium]|nr:16S rRNA processing protein RimM [Bacteroidales bacterium]